MRLAKIKTLRVWSYSRVLLKLYEQHRAMMDTAHIEQTLLTHIKSWEHFDDVPLAKENRNFKPLMAFGVGLRF